MGSSTTRIVRGAGAATATLAMVGVLAGTAGASVTGATTLKLSGAGKGTLTEGKSGICTNARNQGVDLLDLTGSISGFKSAAEWTITVEAPTTKGGTFKINSTSGSGQLDPIGKHPTAVQEEAAILNATKGTFTFKGEKGSMNVTFGTGHKAITVKGSWNCSA
jgi:hypothetical protein